jgi:DNA invertase Pin-like site-specific DNA recombinase
MMDVFAELERSMIQERDRAGLARVRSEGKQLGRPRRSKSVGAHRGRVARLRLVSESIRAQYSVLAALSTT